MKRLLPLLLVPAGLAGLLAGCGGGSDDGNVILAVAFRLDSGSPVMAAYVGDPTSDPFEPPAGSYYIEALDEDEVGVSLGTVDVADGDAVAIPESFEDAGGVADPEQSDPLITVASFLLDVELAEYAYLDVATGGFTLPPFDPAVELDASSLRELFDLHRQIGAQKDAVLQALSEIEGRAVVSTGRSYVRSAAAAAPGEFDQVKSDAREFFDLVLGGQERQRQRALNLIESHFGYDEYLDEWRLAQFYDDLPHDLRVVDGREVPTMGEWARLLTEGRLDDKLPEIHTFLDDLAGVIALQNLLHDDEVKEPPFDPDKFWSRVDEYTSLLDKSGWLIRQERAWQAYARDLAEEQGEDDPAETRRMLEERIGRNVAELFPENPQLSEFVMVRCLARVVRAVPEVAGLPAAVEAAPRPTATPPAFTPSASTPQPTPDTSWIEGFVERVGERMIEEGYHPGEAAIVMVDLEECLVGAVLARRSMEEAVQECAAQFEEGTPTPSAEPEEPAEEGEEVSAVGRLLAMPPGVVGPNSQVEENRMSLTFSTDGGAVTGEAVIKGSNLGETCPPGPFSVTMHFEGTYDPNSARFEGTWRGDMALTFYSGGCDNPETVTQSGEGQWEATLEGSVVRGRIPLLDPSGTVLDFELTVQE